MRDQISALGSNLLIVSPGSSTASSGVRGGFGSGVDADPAGRRRARRPDASRPTSRAVAPTVELVRVLDRRDAPTGRRQRRRHHARRGSRCAPARVRQRPLLHRRPRSTGAARWSCSAPTPPPSCSAAADPVGQTVTIERRSLTVIGVLDIVGLVVGRRDQDDQAVVPDHDPRSLVRRDERHRVSTIYVEATAARHSVAAYQEVTSAAAQPARRHRRRAPTSPITSQESLVADRDTRPTAR